MATVSVCSPHGLSLLGGVSVLGGGVVSFDWLLGELVTVDDGVGVDEGRELDVGVEVAVGAEVVEEDGSVRVGGIPVGRASLFVVVSDTDEVTDVPVGEVLFVPTGEVLLLVPDNPPIQPARRTIATIIKGTRAVICAIVGNHRKDVFDSDPV
jgi:hypothetical protein